MAKSKSPFISTFLMTWWFPLLVGVVVVFGTVFVLIPQVSEIMTLSNDLEVAKEKLIKSQTKIAEMANLDGLEIDQLTALGNEALPDHKPYFEVLNLLQQLSAQTGALLGTFELSPGSLATASAAKAAAGYETLSTEVSVTGTVDQVTQFIEGLQQSLPLVSVGSIVINDQERGAIEQREAQFEVEIHYLLPRPDKTATVHDPLPAFDQAKQSVFGTLSSYTRFTNPTATAESVVDFSRTNLFTY